MTTLVHFTRVSNNSKVGPIPVSTSSQETCPPSCNFKHNGCYAQNFPLSLHWKAVTDGRRGMPWEEFCDEISRLPKGQPWRHNQAGDLQGANGLIDKVALRQLTAANKGKRGWSYTHYPMVGENLRAVRAAVRGGLVINVSADTLAQAEILVKKGLPTVAVVPRGWRGSKTPGGLPVTLCPAQVIEHMSCAVCQLCAKPDRRAIVAFEAHGARLKTIERIINITETS